MWHRVLHDGLRAGLEHLTPDQMPALRTLVAVDAVESAVLDGCKAAGMPDGRLAAMLADDVATLATLFAEILAQPFLRLTLDAPGHAATPPFLMAMERARLFCSYRGRGVQFGPARPDGPPREVLELAPGVVAIFRGFLWRSKQLPGIVHRVPLAERPGESPLLLVIDTRSTQSSAMAEGGRIAEHPQPRRCASRRTSGHTLVLLPSAWRPRWRRSP